jgi:putative transcriptional regulator
LFAQISMPLKPSELEDVLVHFGGPVQTDRGFVLHEAGGRWQSTLQVNDKIGLTTSKDILQAVGEGQGPRHMLVTLGYAGWSEGQLEQELADNAWLSVPASEHILFDLPADEKLPAAMALLGIDYATLSEEAGHA